MEDNTTVFYQIIDELCEEKNISQKMLSYEWNRELKKDNKIKNLIRYQFDLNSANSFRIAGDKYATYAILKANNIPIMEHKMIFNPDTREEYYDYSQINDAISLLNDNKKVIIKANQSSKGKHVVLCRTPEDIKNAIDKFLTEDKDTISACPYIDIEYEYRAVFLSGEVLYIYKKEKPYIIGNGINTISELILQKFGEDNTLDIIKELDLNYIPLSNEKVTVSWKHNLCNGATPIVINEQDEYYSRVKEIAEDSGKAIGITFATIDIAITTNKELCVVEVNASVCLDRFAVLADNGYSIAKEIYSKAIDVMFNN